MLVVTYVKRIIPVCGLLKVDQMRILLLFASESLPRGPCHARAKNTLVKPSLEHLQ